jgi:hypothetical protein
LAQTRSAGRGPRLADGGEFEGRCHVPQSVSISAIKGGPDRAARYGKGVLSGPARKAAVTCRQPSQPSQPSQGWAGPWLPASGAHRCLWFSSRGCDMHATCPIKMQRNQRLSRPKRISASMVFSIFCPKIAVLHSSSQVITHRCVGMPGVNRKVGRYRDGRFTSEFFPMKRPTWYRERH